MPQHLRYEFDINGVELHLKLDLIVLDCGTGRLNNNELSLNNV
jgi:hypothetical protein